MRRRDGPAEGQDLERRSIPFGKIWSAFTSEVGSILEQGTESTTHGSASITTSPAQVTMITKEVPVPVQTTTVDQTITRTSFVTVRLTTAIPVHHGTRCADLDSCDPGSTTTRNTKHTSLPDVVTHGTSSITSKSTSKSGIGPHQTDQSATAPSAASSPSVSHNKTNQKHAIIGGLSGAIAGLVLIGALIIFFLRRRRKREEDGESRESMSEKGLRPILARKWSQLTSKRNTLAPELVVSRGSTPDFDGGLIRVSIDNWPRPFAHGQSYRESIGPGRLMVMNPDPSRPETPLRRSSESNTGGGWIRQPRSAFAAFLGGRSRNNSASGTPDRNLQVPTIAVDSASSSERGIPATYTNTPSFRSYPSVSSLPYVENHPPDDPFLTPPDERDELTTTASTTPRRPSIAPLQSAAKSLSQLGSALNPFRSKSNAGMSARSAQSRQSVSTFFSSSSAGDPFKLDRPSVHESSFGGRAGSDYDRPDVPRWTVYEGT